MYPCIDELFSLDFAFDAGDRARQLFLCAMKEAFEHHFERCDIYRRICINEGFTPEDLREDEDLCRIPHIMVHVFKWYTLTSLPKEEIAYEFTSSGTSGQKSHILWDEGSRRRQTIMRETIVESMGMKDEDPVNYVLFTYAPDVAGSRGAAYAHRMYTSFAPAKRTFFAIRGDGYGMPWFDLDGTIEHLVEFERDGIPVRLIGFPAFMHETLRAMRERGIRLSFPEKSLVITAGGWKDKEEQKIPVEEFAAELFECLGIRRDRLFDIYGFVEHGVPYISCPYGRFHVPIYSRAFVRKPGTLEILPYGEKGLLHVLSPYNLAQPALSVLSTDYAVMGRDCPCGLKTDYFVLLGRAGVKKHKGCAISAAELLKSKGHGLEGTCAAPR